MLATFKKIFCPLFSKKFCLWLSKKYLESKSNFHSVVMNSTLLIKCSCEKIFVANFAFFKYYNIFFIKLQVKKPSTWIGSDMPGPRRAAHVSEKIFWKNFFCFGREEVKIEAHFCERKKRIWGWVRKAGLGHVKLSWTARPRIIPHFNQFVK